MLVELLFAAKLTSCGYRNDCGYEDGGQAGNCKLTIKLFLKMPWKVFNADYI